MNHFYPKRTIMFRQSPYRCSCSVHTSRWLPICCWQCLWALSSGTGRDEKFLVSSTQLFILVGRENQLRHHHHVSFSFFGRLRRRRLFPTFLRCLVCAQPTDKQFVFRADRAGGSEYCHQKLITIKISGEKAAKEKIVQGSEKNIERLSNNGNQHEFRKKKH